ncbi:hypothetical protein E3U23_09770 [Erythrobacter litoralis]|uniref:hypothetical protein n=1 Tax=Erythrobacter litoralis TaxID=39960 RepID=UPI0024348F60|nr:hypothetical protein [Erythrobacter litoralis]MDG6079480.1 hypothetical protein [Erythrobacter litoralis]
MKPTAIKRFDWLYLGAIVLSTVATFINYDSLMAQMEAELATSGAESVSSIALIGGFAFGIVVSLALWFLVSVLRIGLVKWIIAIFAGWGAVSFVLSMLQTGFDVSLVLGAIAVIMNVAAAALLFTPEARAWFASKTSDQPD